MGFLGQEVEESINVDVLVFIDVDVLDGRIEPSLGIECHHRGVALERGCGLLAGVSGSMDGTIDDILGACNGASEGVFYSGGSLEAVEVRWLTMFLNGNLTHDVLIGKDESNSDGRKRQDGRYQLHFDGYENEDEDGRRMEVIQGRDGTAYINYLFITVPSPAAFHIIGSWRHLRCKLFACG